MLCHQCGHQLPESAKFCGSCGAKQGMGVGTQSDASSPMTVGSGQNKSSNRKKYSIAALVLVVIAGGAGYFLSTSKQVASDSPNVKETSLASNRENKIQPGNKAEVPDVKSAPIKKSSEGETPPSPQIEGATVKTEIIAPVVNKPSPPLQKAWTERSTDFIKNTIVNDPSLATSILKITHPTGNNPSIGDVSFNNQGNTLSVEIIVNWFGGFSGTQYSTVVRWEMTSVGHLGARVVRDSAPFAVANSNAIRLNNYFGSQLYPSVKLNVGEE